MISVAFHILHFVPGLLTLTRSHIVCPCPACPTWNISVCNSPCGCTIANAHTREAREGGYWEQESSLWQQYGVRSEWLCDCGCIQCWCLLICYRWNEFLSLSKNYSQVTAYHTAFVLHFQKENELSCQRAFHF